MAREQRLEVKVPTPEEDKPRFARVGVIAGVGFAIGIAWPWLAGVKLVPSPPSEEVPVVTASASPEPVASTASPAQTVSADPSGDVSQRLEKRLKVGRSSVTSCKDARGRSVSDCDLLDVDALMVPHIEALQNCPGTDVAQGVLSLGVRIDFKTKRVERIMQGKSTTLPHTTARALLACARRELADVSFENVKHNQEEYTVFFLLELTPTGEARGEDAAPPASGDVTPMTGSATVSWQSAKVRGEPNKDAEELARLLSGTRVIVTGRQGSWYRVKYGAKGEEGWIYKAAIGL